MVDYLDGRMWENLRSGLCPSDGFGGVRRHKLQMPNQRRLALRHRCRYPNFGRRLHMTFPESLIIGNLTVSYRTRHS